MDSSCLSYMVEARLRPAQRTRRHPMKTTTFAAAALLTAGTSFTQIVIPSGAKVSCRLEQTISSATAQEGQAVNLSVTEDVRINDVVVIKQGATVYGSIVTAQERRRMGRSGKLDFTIDKVRAADGEFISLRYTPYKKSGEGKGVTTGVLTAGAAILFWPAAPAFLLIKGKDVSINKGVTVDVFTDADHTMKSASYQQAPVVTSGAPGAAHPAGAGPAIGVEMGSVTVDADIEGAEIEIDGMFVGNTPTTRRMPAGAYSITVRDGVRVWERKVAVQAGDSVRLRAKLDNNTVATPARTSAAAPVRRH
jgi:hypothetical protein